MLVFFVRNIKLGGKFKSNNVASVPKHHDVKVCRRHKGKSPCLPNLRTRSEWV